MFGESKDDKKDGNDDHFWENVFNIITFNFDKVKNSDDISSPQSHEQNQGWFLRSPALVPQISAVPSVRYSVSVQTDPFEAADSSSVWTGRADSHRGNSASLSSQSFQSHVVPSPTPTLHLQKVQQACVSIPSETVQSQPNDVAAVKIPDGSSSDEHDSPPPYINGTPTESDSLPGNHQEILEHLQKALREAEAYKAELRSLASVHDDTMQAAVLEQIQVLLADKAKVMAEMVRLEKENQDLKELLAYATEQLPTVESGMDDDYNAIGRNEGSPSVNAQPQANLKLNYMLRMSASSTHANFHRLNSIRQVMVSSASLRSATSGYDSPPHPISVPHVPLETLISETNYPPSPERQPSLFMERGLLPDDDEAPGALKLDLGSGSGVDSAAGAEVFKPARAVGSVPPQDWTFPAKWTDRTTTSFRLAMEGYEDAPAET